MKKGNKPASLRDALRASHATLGAVALFSLGINLLMLTGPIFMLQIYSRVLPSGSTETLTTLFAIVIVLFVALGLLEAVRSRVLGGVATQLATRIRDAVFSAVMRLSLRSGASPGAAQPMRELDVVTGFYSGAAITAFYDAPLVPVFIFTIYLLHPLLALFAVFAAVVLLVLAVVNDLLSRQPQQDSVQASARAQGMVESAIRNAEVLKALGMLRRVRARWRARHDTALWHQAHAHRRVSAMAASGKALRLLIQSAMLALGAWLVIGQEITAGAMIAASIILGRALQPLEAAMTHWRGYQRYRLARQQLDELLRAESALDDTPGTTPETEPVGQLQVHELFAAPPGATDPFLKNINFKLPAGRILLVKGPNGSGKTMLIRLLVGVWQPLKGGVMLDGADLRTWPEEDLGRLIGYVPQDVELLEGTVGENISRFDPDADEEAIISAARQAGADAAIKALGGYDRQVGPGGAFLSAGQRQRVALARAMYGSPVLLVLDEPGANLDPAARKSLRKALHEARERGQTVVIVDHDPEMARIADYVMVLNNGTILKAGATRQNARPQQVEKAS